MTSKYSRGPPSYSPSFSPQGRRYVLKNLNIRKQREIKKEKARDRHKEPYYDIRAAPASQGSMGNQSSKPVGTSNRVMPTETNKSNSPSKTPREPMKYISPRRDPSPRKENERKENTKAKSLRKKVEEKSNKSDKNSKTKHGIFNHSQKETGLTPRDEYIVTKLYDREIIYLKPSEVRFTHDQITAHFSDGRPLLATFVALLYGKIDIKLGGVDVPPIEVMQTSEMEGGRDAKIWYVVNGNRRLFVFQKLEKCGALVTMQVIARKYDSIEMDKHFLTRNHGRSVSVTHDASIHAKFDKETKKWKECAVKQPKRKRKGGRGKGGKQSGNNPNEKNSSCCCLSCCCIS